MNASRCIMTCLKAAAAGKEWLIALRREGSWQHEEEIYDARVKAH